MNSPRLKYEGWLYGLAFLLALGFRLIQLGATPLSDSEAALALQAFHLAQGKDVILGPQPGYILFTSLLFSVIEATNFMARILPALAGSAIIFVPWLLRDRLQPRIALIAAFLLAFDPGMVALARQADGTMLAVTFTLFAIAMWINRRPIPLGIFAGLALLSGPSIWFGAVILGLTWLFLRGTASKPETETELIIEEGEETQVAEETGPAIVNRTPQAEASSTLAPDAHLPRAQMPGSAGVVNRNSLIALAATLLLAGTLFFTVPNGLSAWLDSLPTYITGWTSASLTTPLRTLVTFLVYEPLGIFLTVFAIIRSFSTNNKSTLLFSLWLGVALLLAIFYRQPAQLTWAIIPLLVLAATELSEASEIYEEERVEVGVVVIAITILLTYIWFNVSNIALNPYGQAPVVVPLLGSVENPRFVVLFGSLAIVIACILLVALGWSMRTAWLGSIWSFVIFLVIYTAGSAWGTSGLRTPSGVELWNPDPKPQQANLLLSSVKQVSEYSVGDKNSQPVLIMGINSPALEWLLRDNNAQVVSALDPLVAPPLVITPIMNDLGLPSAYRGQDFTWRQGASWASLLPMDRLSWFVFHKVPLENETIILWARDDLFPDARESSNTP